MFWEPGPFVTIYYMAYFLMYIKSGIFKNLTVILTSYPSAVWSNFGQDGMAPSLPPIPDAFDRFRGDSNVKRELSVIDPVNNPRGGLLLYPRQHGIYLYNIM